MNTQQEIQVVELRQQDRNKSVTQEFGCYTTRLNQTILLNQNDVVKIKSCYIDSQAIGPDDVFIPEDVVDGGTMKITIKHGVYVRDYGSTLYLPGTQREYQVTSTADSGEHINDGFDYVLCGQTDGSNPDADTPHLIQGIHFESIPTTNSGGDPPKIAHINMTYKDVLGQDQIFRIQISESELLNIFSMVVIDGQRVGRYIINENTIVRESGGKNPLPFACMPNTLTFAPHTDKHFESSTKQASDSGLKHTKDQSTLPQALQDDSKTIAQATTYTPRIFTQTYLLPSGVYNKNELARELTVLFSKVNNPSKLDKLNYDIQRDLATGKLNGNLFLMSSEAIRTQIGLGPSGPNHDDATSGAMFVRTDGSDAFKFKLINTSGTVANQVRNYWVGSSEGLAIDYDQTVQKFHVVSMHSSIINKSGNKIVDAVDGFTNTTPPVPISKINNKYSGLYLTELLPTKFWFWEDMLNLDESILTHTGKTGITGVDPIPNWTAVGGGGGGINVPLLEFQDGVNVTGDLIVLDTFVFKGGETKDGVYHPTDPNAPPALTALAFDVCPNLPDFDSATLDTISIYASNDDLEIDDILSNREEKSFFKIEVDMGISLDLSLIHI